MPERTRIPFRGSERPTLGVEWEMALVDEATGELVGVADRVHEALRGPDGEPAPRSTASCC